MARMMARMPSLTATAGGRRRLVDLCAMSPSATNWQEPLGQGPITPLSSWPSDTKSQVLIVASLVIIFIIIFCCALHHFCRNKEQDDLDTNSFDGGPWINDDTAEDISAPPPLPLQEQQLPESGDGQGPQSNSAEEGDRPPQRRRRRQQPPAVVEVPAADVELAQAGVEWELANLELLAPAADVEMAPWQEPAPTLKCTYSKAEGWAEGNCSVCLSELVDGEKVRVLTGCMHCFHATCPLCRAPAAMAVPARGRRRRRPADPNL